MDYCELFGLAFLGFRVSTIFRGVVLAFRIWVFNTTLVPVGDGVNWGRVLRGEAPLQDVISSFTLCWALLRGLFLQEGHSSATIIVKPCLAFCSCSDLPFVLRGGLFLRVSRLIQALSVRLYNYFLFVDYVRPRLSI